MDLPFARVSSSSSNSYRPQRTLGLVFQETVDFRDRPVVGHDSEAVVRGIENQVLAHDGQTDKAEITTRSMSRERAGVHAGRDAMKSVN